MKGLTAKHIFEHLGGKIHHEFPPVPTRKFDYSATHPLITDEETGGELDIGNGETAERAAMDGLQSLLDYLDEELK